MSLFTSETLLRYQASVVYLWYKIGVLCGFLNFDFNSKVHRFEVFSKKKLVVRCVLYNLIMAYSMKAMSRNGYPCETVVVLGILIPYPLSLYFKLFMQQQRIIHHLNELLQCIRRTENLTGRYIIFSLPFYITLMLRLFGLAVGFNILTLFLDLDLFETTYLIYILCYLVIVVMQPFMGVYIYSHLVSVELFCVRTMMMDLNDYLSDWAQGFNFYQERRLIWILRPTLRELARIYMRLVRSLFTLNDILGAHVAGLFFMMSSGLVYMTNSDDIYTPVGLSLLLYLNCLGDVIFGYTCYRSIWFELTRTQTLTETINLRPDFQMDRDINCLVVAVDIAKLGLDVFKMRTQTAFCGAIGIVFIKVAYNFGS